MATTSVTRFSCACILLGGAIASVVSACGTGGTSGSPEGGTGGLGFGQDAASANGEGGTSNESGPGGDSGPSGDSSADDSSTGGDTGSVIEAGPPPATKGGSLNVGQSKSGGFASSSESATFYDSHGVAYPSYPSQCTTSAVGACMLTNCDFTKDAGPQPAPVDAGPPPTAGNVTFTGGQIGAGGIVLTPGADGTYLSKGATVAAFANGETLSVQAAGNASGVPAFTQAITPPNDIAVTSPSLGTGTATIVRSTNLVVTWTGGGAGIVSVYLDTAINNNRAVAITCTASASAGTLTVPATTLANLIASSAGATGIISVTQSSKVTFMAGGFQINFTAYLAGSNALLVTQ